MRGNLSRVQRQYFFTNAPNYLPGLIRVAIAMPSDCRFAPPFSDQRRRPDGKRHEASVVAPPRCEV
jgi:hypothetical protein